MYKNNPTILTKENISVFLSKHEKSLIDGTTELPKEDYLYLTHICSFLKKNIVILSKLSGYELELLTTNKIYQIKGLNLYLANIFLEKQSYSIFRNCLFKNSNWMGLTLKLNILNLCLIHHTYNDQELELISQSLFENQLNEESKTYHFFKNTDIISNEQALKVIFNFFEKIPEHTFTQNLKTKAQTQTINIMKGFLASLFHLNDDLSNKLIDKIPTFPLESTVFFLNYCSNFAMTFTKNYENISLTLQEYESKLYSSFINFEQAKKLIQAFVKSWENKTLPNLSNEKNDYTFLFDKNITNVVNNDCKITNIYNLCSDEMKPYIASFVIKNYVHNSANPLSSAIPFKYNLDILNNEQYQNKNLSELIKVLKLNIKYPNNGKIDILLHFLNPIKYKLLIAHQKDIINSIAYLEKKENNNGDIVKFVVNQIGFDVFKKESNSASSTSDQVIAIALDLELNEIIPINNKPTSPKVRKF